MNATQKREKLKVFMSLAVSGLLTHACGQSIFEIKNLISSNEARIDRIVREKFIRNFVYQNLCSFSINCIAFTLEAGAVYAFAMGTSVVAISLTVSAAVIAIFNYYRGNHPNQLMRKALHEVENGNEIKALELIQKGANLDICSTKHLCDFVLELGCLIRDVIKCNVTIGKIPPITSTNIFDAAGNKRQKTLLRYLYSIGFDLKKTYILQTADSLETIQYLVNELGMPVNKFSKDDPRFAPLYFQTIQMLSIAKYSDDTSSIEKIRERIKIIRYLLQKGACLDDINITSTHRDLMKQISEAEPNSEPEDILIQTIIKQHQHKI